MISRLGKTTVRKIVLILGFILFVIVVVFIYRKFNPAEYIFPKCPFFMLTGLKCPGCGSQRALYQLLNFNLWEAFKYNASLVLSIPLLLFLSVAYVIRNKAPKLYRISYSPILSWSILVLLLLWWLLRNIFGW